ncbi:hypothetical protein GQ53DRAFT_338475 [Thozetella sp. PMI_491]|nr:hypothetical protein GQ53DRAFT_338475 [Thozetella sp. PMI_491]
MQHLPSSSLGFDSAEAGLRSLDYSFRLSSSKGRNRHKSRRPIQLAGAAARCCPMATVICLARESLLGSIPTHGCRESQTDNHHDLQYKRRSVSQSVSQSVIQLLRQQMEPTAPRHPGTRRPQVRRMRWHALAASFRRHNGTLWAVEPLKQMIVCICATVDSPMLGGVGAPKYSPEPM